MSDYGSNQLTPTDIINAKHLRTSNGHTAFLFVNTGTVTFSFPDPTIVDPNDWTRGTLTFTVPGLSLPRGQYINLDASAVVLPATWDLTARDAFPGWGVDWSDAAWDGTELMVVRAGIASKTGGSELLRCGYTVHTQGAVS